MNNKGQNIIVRAVLQKLFLCNRCGDCCKSNIVLYDIDIEQLSKGLKISKKTFLRKFTHKINGNVNGNEWNREKGNKEIEGNEEDARKTYLCLKKKGSFCEFYINGNCKIYHFRPSICKIFPFMALRNEESDLEASPFRKFVEGCCPGTKYVTGKEWAIKRIMESKGVGEKDAAIILELITEETTNELIKFGFIDKNRNYINPNG